MNPRILRILAFATFVFVAAGAIRWLHRTNARLREQVANLHRRQEQAITLRTENQKARDLATPANSSAADADIPSEVLRLRAEIAAREHRNEPGRNADAASGLNRDPEKNLARLEFFQDVGNATPRAAVQTLAWAALHGDQARVAQLLTFDAPARVTAESWLAALPPEAREKFPTAESLAALLWADVITAHDAARIDGELFSAPGQAAVTLSFARAPGGQPLPLQLGSQGWQLRITPEFMPILDRMFRGEAAKLSSR